MVIYMCHQFGGKDENRILVEKKICDLYANYMRLFVQYDVTLFSPIHATGYLYNHMSYDDGMRQCYVLLSKCDMMVTFGEMSMSEGCTREKKYCAEHGIPIVDINDFIEELQFLSILQVSMLSP